MCTCVSELCEELSPLNQRCDLSLLAPEPTAPAAPLLQPATRYLLVARLARKQSQRYQLQASLLKKRATPCWQWASLAMWT